MKTRFFILLSMLGLSVAAHAQIADEVYAQQWSSSPTYLPGQILNYSPVGSCIGVVPSTCQTGELYASLPQGGIQSIAQSAAGSGMTVGGPYSIACSGGGATTNPAATFYALTATTISPPLITNFGAGISTGSPACTASGTGGTPPTFTATPVYKNVNQNPALHAGDYWQPMNGGIPFKNGVGLLTTLNPNITNPPVCTGCTNSRGTMTITVGSTAATGTLATFAFGNYNGTNALTLAPTPGFVRVTENGSAFGVGHTTISAIGFAVTGSIPAGTVLLLDYQVAP